MNKRYTMDDLEKAIRTRGHAKSTYDQAQRELEVLQEKVKQKLKELETADKDLFKHEKLILEIIGDIDHASIQRRTG